MEFQGRTFDALLTRADRTDRVRIIDACARRPTTQTCARMVRDSRSLIDGSLWRYLNGVLGVLTRLANAGSACGTVDAFGRRLERSLSICTDD